MTSLSIGIATRNRPAALGRCLTSLAVLGGWDLDVLVFDDDSDAPVRRVVDDLGAAHGARVFRDERTRGYIAGRNILVENARHEMVLMLDDDAVLLTREAIARALAVLAEDPRAGAVAFAQAEADGRPWPLGMQPGAASNAAYVPAFIGFANILRRSVFLRLGGYRVEFVFYGEEKDYCKRMLDTGYRTVYLPDALVAHVTDPAGRDERRYVRYAIRNDCLDSLYNDPWPVAAVSVPIRFLRYRRMAARINGGDAGGVGWLLGELRRALPDVWRRRHPIRWTTFREWRRLRSAPSYPA